MPQLTCPECGRNVGNGEYLNVGPDRVTTKYRDAVAEDKTIADIIGPCGHLYDSVEIPCNEMPLPSGFDDLPFLNT